MSWAEVFKRIGMCANHHDWDDRGVCRRCKASKRWLSALRLSEAASR